MKKNVTIKDIASKADVSTGTVDRVLHNRGNVAPEVREKILQVMDELGYERNLLASALAYKRVFRIALLLPDFTKDPYWEQPYSGTQKALKAVKHYGIQADTFLFNLFDPENFLEVAARVIAAQPDGILFPPIFQKEGKWLLDICAEKNIPTITFNTNIENSSALSYIGQDSYQSGVLAGRLLNFALEDGEAAMILNLEKGASNARHLLEKERGFRFYFENKQRKQIQVLRRDIESFENRDTLRAFLMTQLEAFPNLAGIFVTNSRAYRVVNALDEAVVNRIKIVGFDLLQENLKHLYDNKINFLINQNPVEQGYIGLMDLFKFIFLKQEPEPIHYLPLDIVVAENVQYYLNKQESLELVV
ncbi:MAG: substrate-binding domain-containing protein [Saprospiraceae bacterium]|nr:substrate-binding domain-containing protein [Saprospiraceae bacterium]